MALFSTLIGFPHLDQQLTKLLTELMTLQCLDTQWSYDKMSCIWNKQECIFSNSSEDPFDAAASVSMFHPEAVWLKAMVSWGLGSTGFARGGSNWYISKTGANAAKSTRLFRDEVGHSWPPPPPHPHPNRITSYQDILGSSMESLCKIPYLTATRPIADDFCSAKFLFWSATTYNICSNLDEVCLSISVPCHCKPHCDISTPSIIPITFLISIDNWPI